MVMRFKMNKTVIEGIVLIVFLFVIWHLMASAMLEQRLVHTYPHGYFASDAFWQLVGTDQVYNAGSYEFRPAFDSLGHEDVLGVLPPMMYHLAASYAHLVSIPPYDALIMLVTLLFSFSTLIMYLIIRRFNVSLALLSLPFMIMMVSSPNLTAVTWGKHLVIAGGFFLVAFFWALIAGIPRGGWALIGLFLGGMLLSHPPEFIFAIAFLIGILLVDLLTGRFQRSTAFRYGLAVVLGTILALPYAWIFYNTMWKGAASTISLFEVIPKASYPVLTIADFINPLGIVLILGLLLVLIKLLQSLRKDRLRSMIMLMALYMLALGLSNYVGMHDRSFQQRYFWPLYLAIFFGLTLYTAVNYLSKLLRTRRSFLISLVVSIILIIVMVGAEVEPVQSPGLIHPLLWEGFLWVRENTQQDDRILFAYGDGLDQKPVLLMGQRRSWFIEQESLISTMQQGILSPSFIIGEVANTDGSNPYRTSLLTFDTHYKPGLTKNIGERSVCDFDYIVIPRVSRQEAFAIYNNLMRNHLLLSSDRQETFSNQYLSIIRNDAPGGQCYEETKLA